MRICCHVAVLPKSMLLRFVLEQVLLFCITVAFHLLSDGRYTVAMENVPVSLIQFNDIQYQLRIEHSRVKFIKACRHRFKY